MRPLLLLTPEIYSLNGGIQRYMRRLAEIMADYAERDGDTQGIVCHSLLDSSHPQPLHDRPVAFRELRGAEGNKIRFVLQAIALGWRHRPRLAVVGHHGILPVAWLLKKLGLLDSYALVLHGIEAWRRVPWLDRVAVRGATAMVATTRYTAHEFATLNGASEDKIAILPLAVGEDDIPAENGAPRPANGSMSILTVGRLTEWDRFKGFDMLVESVGHARREGADLRLTVVGTGSDLHYLQDLTRERGLTDTVAFLGSVSDTELARQYRECDVFAMPSKKEGFGIVYLEAMRYGKPCIGGNHGGVPEVIDHGVNGFLVEHGEVEQLGKVLVDLWRDPEMRVRMGQNAAEKVRNHFLVSHMRAGWFAFFDSLDRGVNKAGRNRS